MNYCEACNEYEWRIVQGRRILQRLDPKPWREADRRHLRQCREELKRLSACWQEHMHQAHQLSLFEDER